jgi:bifunctional N-acetylglucosamine-1-phosphate-uridyltransferase/glucosamine-1-phosphate-acetyltransferase GlmU-like protein
MLRIKKEGDSMEKPVRFYFEREVDGGKETRIYEGKMTVKAFVKIGELAGFIPESETRDGSDLYLTFRMSVEK